MVLNASFNNISVISWHSVLLVEETRDLPQVTVKLYPLAGFKLTMIRINHYDFNHSPKAINSLITQSACVYLDLLPHVKRMLTEIYAGIPVISS
jgi:hypothetical protein